ncbi:MAG: antitoxin [Acidimicrobiia bacterium]|nr:antitoxin [Acidimicrobiia bacterium]
MRTTVDIDDDVLAAARTLAAERRVSIGTALSDLARQGMLARRIGEEHGLPVFDVGEDASLITPDMVREAADEP